MNENAYICATLRKDFSKVGWALLIYYGIMNAAVLVMTIMMSFVNSMQFLSDPNVSAGDMAQQIADDGAWGYALAVLAGAFALLMWKKKEFCFKTIWKSDNPMTWGKFFALLAIFISGQALYQVLTPLIEWLFNLIGISLVDSIASASGTTDAMSMFLFVGLLAPIWEEILFRGYVMRTLQPYGKKFAILASAFLFGVYHGNPVQTPFAFVVGLVLGYVAMEHNMVWAMVLHMINNLLLGDTMGRLLQDLPMVTQEAAFMAVIWGCTLAAVIVLICKRKAVVTYFRQGKMHPLCLKSFFTSPGILTMTGVILGSMMLGLLLMM